MKITTLKMTTPEQTADGFEHWVDVRYTIGRRTYCLTKLILHDEMITDLSVIEELILSDKMELFSHAYEVLKLNRQWMKENWWLF